MIPIVLFQSVAGGIAMYPLVALTIVAAIMTGCGDRPTVQHATHVNSTPSQETHNSAALMSHEHAEPQALTEEQSNFGAKWKAVTLAGRRGMADVAKVGSMFQGASKTQINQLFGEATQAGVDKFGEDVLRYELGDVPEADGGGKYHLTFVFEDNVVVRVMGNLFSLSP